MAKIKIQRGNVILDIQDYEVDRYLKMGYNVIAENGEVIKSSIPTDLATLQKFYVEHTKRIDELEKRVAELTYQIEGAKAMQKPAKSTKKS